MDHNPHLKPWKSPTPNNTAGKGTIEIPGQVDNIVWQTRPRPATDYENQLGDALVALFDSGVEDLDGIVNGLNKKGMLRTDGRPWDEASFEAEIKRLGA